MGWACLAAFTYGLWLALFASPPAVDHGHGVRIMYIHVPAAWCALLAYALLTIASLISFIWRHPLADVAARSLAVPGMAFTFLALFTGSLWGKFAWGTWWEWDGRMTSVLVLLFIYMGYLALWQVTPDHRRAARLASILAMIGFINIPIIKFSVDWWDSLHQTATYSSPGAPGTSPEIFLPLLTMALAYSLLLGWLSFRSVEAEIIRNRAQREKNAPAATATIEAL